MPFLRIMRCGDVRARRDLMEGVPDLVLCPREFDLPQVVPHAVIIHLEAMVETERPDDGSFDRGRIAGPGPLVFASLGTVAEEMPELAHGTRTAVLQGAAAHPTWRVLLCGPPMADAPANVTLVPRVPQVEVLRRADAMVTHTGLGSAKECICSGVPMVAMPLGYDQPGNAARIQLHRVGHVIPPGPRNGTTAGPIIADVITDRGCKARVIEIRASFLRSEREQDAIEVLLAGRSGPDPRAVDFWIERIGPAVRRAARPPVTLKRARRCAGGRSP